MSVAPIGGAVPIAGIQPVDRAAGAAKVDFAAGLEAVNQATQHADSLAGKVATGELKDVHEFMAASAKANLAVELTVAVRNRAVEAYQEIMRMQI